MSVQAVKKIQEALGEDRVSIEQDDIESHGYSEWSTSNSTERPVAIVTPRSTEEVSAIVKFALNNARP